MEQITVTCHLCGDRLSAPTPERARSWQDTHDAECIATSPWRERRDEEKGDDR